MLNAATLFHEVLQEAPQNRYNTTALLQWRFLEERERLPVVLPQFLYRGDSVRIQLRTETIIIFGKGEK